MSRSDGFTLVEVLVAVAVLAIALSAVIAAMARQADNAGYLKQKTVALWVAHNRLAELQLQTEPPAIGRADGEVEMAGAKWRWETLVTNTEDERLRRAEVSVRAASQTEGSLAELTGFFAVAK